MKGKRDKLEEENVRSPKLKKESFLHNMVVIDEESMLWTS